MIYQLGGDGIDEWTRPPALPRLTSPRLTSPLLAYLLACLPACLRSPVMEHTPGVQTRASSAQSRRRALFTTIPSVRAFPSSRLPEANGRTRDLQLLDDVALGSAKAHVSQLFPQNITCTQLCSWMLCHSVRARLSACVCVCACDCKRVSACLTPASKEMCYAECLITLADRPDLHLSPQQCPLCVYRHACPLLICVHEHVRVKHNSSRLIGFRPSNAQ